MLLTTGKIPVDVSHTLTHSRLGGLKPEIKYVKFLCDSYLEQKLKKSGAI
jgi:hypothetical protein